MLITTAGTILKGFWQGVLLWEAFIGEKTFLGAFGGDLSWAGGVKQAGNWGVQLGQSWGWGSTGIFTLGNVQDVLALKLQEHPVEHREEEKVG